MGSSYIPPPEQNVVNVGDEISINALNGIAQANPAITSTNPVATDNSVATAVSGKANLSGAAFTGDVTTTGRVGIGGPVPVNANNKLGVYNGNIVFSAGWGLAFGDGTTQTTAPNLTGYAQLSGAAFTGNVTASANSISARRIIGQPNAGVAGVNVGIGGTDAASTTAGDLWITTSGSTFNYRDGLGSWRIIASRNLANTFTFPQTISATDATNPMLSITQNGNGGGLRIQNNGTGDCLTILDESSDTTPFIINGNGQVGIQQGPQSGGYVLSVNGPIWTTSSIRVTGITLGSTDIITEMRKQGDIQYLSKNIASSISSWVFNGTHSNFTINDEILISLLNAWGNLVTIEGNMPIAGTSATFSGQVLSFAGDASNSGANSEVTFNVSGVGFYLPYTL